MTTLRTRKTRLSFETDQEVRYRGKMRPLIVEPSPWFCVVRLKGTRLRYEIPWYAVFMKGAQLLADKQREDRKAARKKR